MTEKPPDSLFLGGVLDLRIIDGEKHNSGDDGSSHLFGSGRFDAKVEVKCGKHSIGVSTIKSAMLEYRVGKKRWDGFDSVLRPMNVTPNMCDIVDIFVYDCNREKSSDVFGKASLTLGYFYAGECFTGTIPIERVGNTFIAESAESVGSLQVKVVFNPFTSNYISSNSPVSIPWNVSRNKGKFSIGVGYTTPLKDLISISLVMFDNDGSYVDSVSLKKRSSTKGLKANYDEVTSYKSFLKDKHEISFELENSYPKIKAIYVVLSDYTEFGSLENLKSVYLRIKESRLKTELYRYDLPEITKPACSGVLLRMVRSDSVEKAWDFMTYENKWDFESREHGFMIPDLKNMLKDVIPDISSSPNDRLSTLVSGESISVSAHCSEIPKDLSIGLHWKKARKDSKLQVDLGCVMLDEKGGYIDGVNAEKTETTCLSVRHGGEEQGDAGGDKDDQMIYTMLATIPQNVTYMGFYVSTVEIGAILSEATGCFGKLSDKETERVLSVFDITDKTQFDDYNALLVCFFFKFQDLWYFQVAGAGAKGISTEELTEHFKKQSIGKNVLQRRMQINANNAKLIKRYKR